MPKVNMKCCTNMPDNAVTDTFYNMLKCHTVENVVIQASKGAGHG